MKFPEELRYTKEHEWVAVKGNVATMGITDYAQGELGDVVFVELPQAGTAVSAMKALGTIEAVKTVADLFSPLTGKVLEVNTALADRPDLVNHSPFDKGWMVRLEVSDPSELKALLTAAQYRALVEGGGAA